MPITTYSKLIFTFLGVCLLSFFTSCGDKEKDEPLSDPAIQKELVGKWEMYTSGDFEDSTGFEFKSDGTGIIWLYESDNEDNELIIGKIQYEKCVLVNSSTEKVIRIKGSDFYDGPFETYLSITYITDKKLIGKMVYFDGNPFEEDDWFSVNFDKVEEFLWEKR